MWTGADARDGDGFGVGEAEVMESHRAEKVKLWVPGRAEASAHFAAVEGYLNTEGEQLVLQSYWTPLLFVKT
jgi:hypothetical protein